MFWNRKNKEYGLPKIDPDDFPPMPECKPPREPYYIKCSKCGQPVSKELPEQIIVRAFIECPECIKE